MTASGFHARTVTSTSTMHCHLIVVSAQLARSAPREVARFKPVRAAGVAQNDDSGRLARRGERDVTPVPGRADHIDGNLATTRPVELQPDVVGVGPGADAGTGAGAGVVVPV